MMRKLTINVPCESCGCDSFAGVCRKDGVPVSIDVCACNDGGGHYDLVVTYNYHARTVAKVEEFNYQSKEEEEEILNHCFDIDTVRHHCHECESSI